LTEGTGPLLRTAAAVDGRRQHRAAGDPPDHRVRRGPARRSTTTATPGRGRRPSVRGPTRQERDPVSIDIGDLDTVAKHLATGAMGIDELGSDPAPIPDAGAATALLVDT